ncbi:hypothetical protein [Agarilytica rhodophyticola]|uniref:hypothetical protein n=1 Tax=Agarilytica rhodophyticola TaxID=1737490 RepID=UPI000B344DE8|nr:hypothetical protein [Agarilytica rhodophyticola]
MTLYSVHENSEKFATLGFDQDQMFTVFGKLRNQFSVNYQPKPYAEKLIDPLKVNFGLEDPPTSAGTEIPDISNHYGRLFLNPKAYDALKDLLKNDGEFLPVVYENGKGYIFNTLSVAESVDGLDKKLSLKNEYGDVRNVAFDKNRVGDFMIFRTSFDNYINAYVHQKLKDAIEDADLHGVYFSIDLGNPYSEKHAQSLQND